MVILTKKNCHTSVNQYFFNSAYVNDVFFFSEREATMIKICIVHFNTQRLTECLLLSIRKYTPNSHNYLVKNHLLMMECLG